MLNTTIRRHAPFWLSIAAGIAIWEIAGRSTSQAFMVPFSVTIKALWQLMLTGEFIRQFADSSELFLTGFILALIVGMPTGMLLARVRVLRIGVEPYIMILYATPMVALIGRALVGMIAAEFVLSSTGLGQLIRTASQNFDTAGVFASVLVIALIGVALMRAGLAIEQHFARWRQ